MRAELSLIWRDYRPGMQGSSKLYYASLEDPKFSFSVFKQQLAETIAWCKPRVKTNDAEHCLRCSELAPSVWPPANYGFDVGEAEPVIRKRAEMLKLKTLEAINSINLEDGRLLIFLADWCLNEGAVHAESKGYIDGTAETPPWDTWVYQGNGAFANAEASNAENATPYLISWVPSEFTDLVAKSLWAMSTDFLYWIDNIEMD